MNQGTLKLTPDEIDQQKRGQSEMHDYWANETADMGASLNQINTQPAYEQQAAGQTSGSAREAVAAQQAAGAAASNRAQTSANSGSATGRQAGILFRGAGNTSTAAAGGTAAAKGIYTGRVVNALSQGNDIVGKADRSLATDSNIESTMYQQNVQNKSQDMEDFSNAMEQLNSMSSMAGSASGGGGGNG